VDCTAEGKDLCTEVGVKGFPTLKYGPASDRTALKDYSGGRDYESLKQFAEENLGPVCGPGSLSECSDEARAQIETYSSRDPAELIAEVRKLEKKFKEVRKKLKKKQDALKDKQNEWEEDVEAQIKRPEKRDKEEEKTYAKRLKQFEDKQAKLQARKAKIKDQAKQIRDAESDLKAEIMGSGLKYMQMVVKSNENKKEKAQEL